MRLYVGIKNNVGLFLSADRAVLFSASLLCSTETGAAPGTGRAGGLAATTSSSKAVAGSESPWGT